MFLMKEINYLALSHLMNKEPRTENIMHSKLANPRLLESQVKISPWNHPTIQVSQGRDLQSLSIELLLPVQSPLEIGMGGWEEKRNLSLEEVSPFSTELSFHLGAHTCQLQTL